MYHLTIKDNILEKVSYSPSKKVGWTKYCVRVPDDVTGIGKSIFADSCIPEVLAICLPKSVTTIDENAFNLEKLAVIHETENYIIRHKPTHMWPKLFELYRVLENEEIPEFIRDFLVEQDFEMISELVNSN